MKRMLPALVFFLGACPSLAFDTDRTNVREFIDRMVEEHSYDRDSVTRIIAAAEFKESILEAISRPAEKRLQWHE
ncbi:MAG: lytic murein transglycosylase B, partial [Pseudomonadota bacterium]|nr:lytic murein transglycosylase B [Pseudomonadota bacterium]